METRPLELELLAQAGRLLLEFNDSTAEIHRALVATAHAMTDEPCEVAVSYGGLAISLGAEGPRLVPVSELRVNAAIQASVHAILDQVRRGELDPAEALARLKHIEADAPRHARASVVLLLGSAAASLAGLLGADVGAALGAGLATGLGLVARQELGRRHYHRLALPFVAALIGAVLGGLAVRWGWTQTPGLALIVPSLILVPGPHFINGLLDLFDNYLPMSLARLLLAASIVAAAALGIIVGVELTLQEFPTAAQDSNADRLNLIFDMLLACVVASGFAAAYNTMWRHLAMAAVAGMVGHGLRFVALEVGGTLVAATFLGTLGVGFISAWFSRTTMTPFAVLAYAGAATMMPGIPIYRALGGALQMARGPDSWNSAIVAQTLGSAMQASLVVGALALGLVIAVRISPLGRVDIYARLTKSDARQRKPS